MSVITISEFTLQKIHVQYALINVYHSVNFHCDQGQRKRVLICSFWRELAKNFHYNLNNAMRILKRIIASQYIYARLHQRIYLHFDGFLFHFELYWLWFVIYYLLKNFYNFKCEKLELSDKLRLIYFSKQVLEVQCSSVYIFVLGFFVGCR